MVKNTCEWRENNFIDDVTLRFLVYFIFSNITIV